MEKIRKAVEERQKVQEAELAATLEGTSRDILRVLESQIIQLIAENLRYKRQKHEELMEILRTR